MNIHYIVQFIFFKVIINFIVLGGKKVNNKNYERPNSSNL